MPRPDPVPFVKPTGPLCNLDCHYCYYLKKNGLFPGNRSHKMADIILEEYIVQQYEACRDADVRFSWHGGEPTLLGLDFFRRVVDLQRRHLPDGKRFLNGLMTNGTLLDEEWCRFLAAEEFSIGLSLDGPQEYHDRYRCYRDGNPSFQNTNRGYELLHQAGVQTDILCVVNSHNVQDPGRIYRFFKQINAAYVTFLPLVESVPDSDGQVSERSVPARAFGEFLCSIFDEWKAGDIGRIKVQIFEEAARTAFKLEHSLCIFRKVCGDVPVVEHNGDVFACDHYVAAGFYLGNIIETPLSDLLKSEKQRDFASSKWETLPRCCLECEVLEMCNGGCPKNRKTATPEEGKKRNVLCEAYRLFFNHCRPFVESLARAWGDRVGDG